MAQNFSATREVLNQSPPYEDVDLFALDRPLVEAVAAHGGASADRDLSDFGKHWGSAAMAARGRLANENTPKLRTFDARGNRRDEVEFIDHQDHRPIRVLRPQISRPTVQPARSGGPPRPGMHRREA